MNKMFIAENIFLLEANPVIISIYHAVIYLFTWPWIVIHIKTGNLKTVIEDFPRGVKGLREKGLKARAVKLCKEKVVRLTHSVL